MVDFKPSFSSLHSVLLLTVVHHLVHAVLLDELPVLRGEEAPPLAHLENDEVDLEAIV